MGKQFQEVRNALANWPLRWCGLGEEYCTSPDCQINYGPGCDGNQKPSGVDTSKIARPKLGKVTYGGAGIYDCVNKGDIALTFDDGPWNYTDDLLDKLAGYEAKATFFITGNNLYKGQINDPTTPWPAVIQRMAAEGHQIASHTWSHENFSQLTTTQFTNQIIYNEIAFNDILGYFPTYMRPPFSICPTRTCGAQLATLGYHAIYFDLDTEGYLNDDPVDIQTSKDIWDETIDDSSPCSDSWLQIEHDIHYQTVYNLTDYILESLFSEGYRSVTVGECLGDPPENWYRAGSGQVPTLYLYYPCSYRYMGLPVFNKDIYIHEHIEIDVENHHNNHYETQYTNQHAGRKNMTIDDMGVQSSATTTTNPNLFDSDTQLPDGNPHDDFDAEFHSLQRRHLRPGR
ncbi:hypothetical protein GGR57DRAFT_496567 [Xylariaceae sp. FL1272]|nr:hypothetical protein GGR57DRAFT_496567 [Xylariaceae sp. FL1272]